MKFLALISVALLIASASAGTDWPSIIKTALGGKVCLDPKTVNPDAVSGFQALQAAINQTILANKSAVKCNDFKNACQNAIKNNFPCIDAVAFANHEAATCADLVK